MVSNPPGLDQRLADSSQAIGSRRKPSRRRRTIPSWPCRPPCRKRTPSLPLVQKQATDTAAAVKHWQDQVNQAAIDPTLAAAKASQDAVPAKEQAVAKLNEVAAKAKEAAEKLWQQCRTDDVRPAKPGTRRQAHHGAGSSQAVCGADGGCRQARSGQAGRSSCGTGQSPGSSQCCQPATACQAGCAEGCSGSVARCTSCSPGGQRRNCSNWKPASPGCRRPRNWRKLPRPLASRARCACLPTQCARHLSQAMEQLESHRVEARIACPPTLHAL